ncbi:helix-turn-helix domain-containing protein [Lactobacillus mulieris]|uniref:helix-turn-helix domain-containing protein n=1 Tax=Lactobacillus mulieris TaxID=2508708 RepID=UPI001F43A4E8|nr:helix-turn-helix transcriptional regulator [Lactobacillus mulieris]MCF1847082.1 helix-turn-helix domain-containing protein [Lactobacillus mulieris]
MKNYVFNNFEKEKLGIWNMTIGSLLKHQRIAMGLTQKEFSNGIISAAHYSKIENNKHEISATDLFLLLKQNQIDLIDFYNDLYFSNDKVDIINKSILISQAFYKKDKEKVRLLNNLIQNSSVSEEEKLRASLMQAILDGTLADMSNKMKKRIKKSLFEHDYWFQNERYLKLLSNSLIVFDNIEIQYYFNQIYEAYYNEIDIQPYGLLKIIETVK